MIKPVELKRKLDFMTHADCEAVHEASVRVLEKTGISVELSDERVEKLRDLGVRYDKDLKRMYFSEEVIEVALKSAPGTYTLCARNPENDMPMDGVHGYLTSDGSCTKIIDPITDEYRDSTKKDLADLTLVADATPQISFFWPSVSAADMNPVIQPMYELQTVLENTSKHVQAMTAVDPINALGSVEIARAVAGGKEALKERPIISNFLCSISPLAYEGKGLEAVLIFAEAGVPTGFVTMPISCSTAPATIAGNLVQSNAEILAGIAVLELFYPGTPTFYGSCSTTMELKKGGINCGGPEDFLLQNLSARMARFYGIPSNIGTFAPSAKESDWQAGVENTLSGVLSILGSADTMCGGGLICNASVFSTVQMLLDCETFDLIGATFNGTCFDAEYLAEEVIARIGPSNHFMYDKHTLKHMRSIWQPQFFKRGSMMDWFHDGKPTSIDAAKEKIRHIMQTHTPEPLPNAGQVEYILADYEKRYSRGK